MHVAGTSGKKEALAPAEALGVEGKKEMTFSRSERVCRQDPGQTQVSGQPVQARPD